MLESAAGEASLLRLQLAWKSGLLWLQLLSGEASLLRLLESLLAGKASRLRLLEARTLRWKAGLLRGNLLELLGSITRAAVRPWCCTQC